MAELKIQPVLLGTDFNCYGMARSFHEAYGVKSVAFGVQAMATTRYSNLVDVNVIPNFTTDEVFIKTLRDYAKTFEEDKTYVLVSCGDGYSELISKYIDELKQHYVCNYIGEKLFNRLGNKESFYEVCEKYGLPYPKTKIITKEMVADATKIELPFDFPVALKPSNSIEWLSIHFEGRKKAYILDTRQEFDELLPKIYKAGYTDKLICQDFIPGDDSNMRVVNAYVGLNHKVRMLALGHPLLEDPSPSSVGNYMVILPEQNQQIFDNIQKFLESIDYVGFADFDLKYDERDGIFKVFEINIRQGRSSYYCTLNGCNLAQILVEDQVYHTKQDEILYGEVERVWLGAPEKIFYEYAKDNEYKEKAIQLLRQGKKGTTAFYKKDTLKHRLLMHYAFYLMKKKYRQYFVQR
ncbi:carboxylate--amine ligase [Ligilactobacillus equi]|uniref:ATP-grasp protein n=1 Tax=Ligilactobacillus equi DPC 6820 TaxID=1392007 RepID=V7HZ07_9LACO|nr:ATP-grasp protein [Ligilactobacillus equi]ETA75122.1 ATP-grasp protein [Ligilactobacillus equi DPC 6820]